MFIKALAQHARKVTGLKLLGVDVIFDAAGCAYVIDINYFPGYEGMAGVLDDLLACALPQRSP